MARLKRRIKFRRRRRGITKRRVRVDNFLGVPDHRKIEISVPIYATWNFAANTGAYSFANSALSTTNVFNLWNISAGLDASFPTSNELVNMAKTYMLCKLNGVSIGFSRALNISDSVGTWLNLPSLFIDLFPWFNVSFAGDTGLESDTRYGIQILNTGARYPKKFYRFPKMLGGQSSSVIGSGVWNSLPSMLTQSLYSFYLIMDQQLAFVVNSSTTANVSQLLGTMECVLYVSLAKKTYYSS